jgi:hypothetical protein
LGERAHIQARQRRGVLLVKSRRPRFAHGTRAARWCLQAQARGPVRAPGA